MTQGNVIMSQNLCQRIETIIALAMFVGCQTGLESSTIAKADEPKPQATASDKASTASTLPPATPDNSATKTADANRRSPKARTAFYRADAKPPVMPHVLLSKSDEAVCKVKVGDAMPAIELPRLGETNKTKLADLYGKSGTVVIFWKRDRRMAQQQLADIKTDIVEPFHNGGVAVVGVAVDEPDKDAAAAVKKFGATIPNLNDADGKAFAKIGTGRFPRTYVLDPSGKIVWFDIEYSLATRRELHQALEAITRGK
jgi:peroxiredoxin